MRSILWKSAGAALVLIVIVAVALQRLLSWLATSGATAADGALGPAFDTPIDILTWILSITAGLGIVFGSVFLMPAVTSLVASVFVDDIADEVERTHYPAEAPGEALPIVRASYRGPQGRAARGADLSRGAAFRVHSRGSGSSPSSLRRHSS